MTDLPRGCPLGRQYNSLLPSGGSLCLVELYWHAVHKAERTEYTHTTMYKNSSFQNSAPPFRKSIYLLMYQVPRNSVSTDGWTVRE